MRVLTASCFLLLCCACVLVPLASAVEYDVQSAYCYLKSAPGYSVTGSVSFAASASGAVASYSLAGLTAGSHTVNTYVSGDIYMADGSNLGSVYKTLGTVTATSAGSVTSTAEAQADISLTGPNSIIGRGLAVLEGTTVAALCVVGINDELTNTLSTSSPALSKATCSLSPTYNAATAHLAGWIDFTTNSAGTIDVDYFVYGLGGGATKHQFRVMSKGNIGAASGGNTGGVFSTDVNKRTDQAGDPGTAYTQIGALGNGSYPMVTIEGVASGFFTDSPYYGMLNGGLNSIVGRAITVFGPDTSTLRVAQCVIGFHTPEQSLTSYGAGGVSPQITSAQAILYGTTPSPIQYPEANIIFPIVGIVQFSLSDAGMKVEYTVNGLPPGAHGYHVHTYGNLCGDTGADTGGHFNGSCSACRPAGVEQTVGALNNGVAMVADSNGIAKGQYIDNVLSFSGVRSIIGRGIVIHGNGSANCSTCSGLRVAQGVIGRTSELNTQTQAPTPPVYSASCRLRPTAKAPNQLLDGLVTFDYDAATGFTQVKYQVTGLPAGSHGWHVHDWGNIAGRDNGLATGGHFKGSPLRGRPSTPDEVGMLNNGMPIMADQWGYAYGAFTDKYINLTGVYSIVGRSIIIHGDGPNSGARIAQCVIGITAETYSAIKPQCPARINQANFVHRTKNAVCNFEATSNNGQPVNGYMMFTAPEPPSKTVSVRYKVCGLPAGSHNFHVHTYGDIWLKNGVSTGGHFGGCANNTVCRPGTAEPYNVGYIGNGYYPMWVDGSTGCASGELTDDIIALDGDYSIIGRSMVIHALNNSTRIAQCVIGRNDTAAVEDAAPLVGRRPLIRKASCILEPTGNSWVSTSTGYMSFEVVDPSKWDISPVKVRYMVDSLSPLGTRPFHVHVTGNIGDKAKALWTEGHYYGPCGRVDGGTSYPECRPTGMEQSIGFLTNGTGMFSGGVTTNVSYGEFTDYSIKLNGRASIVGRSIVIHGTQAPWPREYQCVVGIVEEGLPSTPPMMNGANQPYVTMASAVLKPTTGYFDPTLRGYADMDIDAASGVITTRLFISGLGSGAHELHVHDYGNLCTYTTDESTLGIGGVFNGTMYNATLDETVVCGASTQVCREGNPGTKQRAGFIGCVNGQDCSFTPDANGVARVKLTDSLLGLQGMNAIISRSLAVVNVATGSIVAEGVIGRQAERYDYMSVSPPPPTYASCLLEPTTQASSSSLSGYISFAQNYAYNGVDVAFKITGMQASTNYKWVVRQFGDVIGVTDGAGMGETFVGSPMGSRNTVGMLNNGATITSTANGDLYGSFLDDAISLTGYNDITGRGVALLDSSGNTVAQCVVGRAFGSEIDTQPTCASLPTGVQAAIAVPQKTVHTANQIINGTFQFFKLSAGVQISWGIRGIPDGTYDLRINEFGDITNDDGSSSGGYLPCTPTGCRSGMTGACADKLGCLARSSAPSTPITITFTNAQSYGSFVDSQLKLTGAQNICGRTLVIAKTTGEIMAQAVIGRDDRETWDVLEAGQAIVTRATCKLQNTDFNPIPGGGFFDFRQSGTYDATTGRSTFEIRFFAWGQPKGYHEFHVHTMGDLTLTSGKGVEGHFIGNCTEDLPCRPGSDIQEVGRLGNGVYLLDSDNKVASGYLTDTVMTLNGQNSIIGRSMVIHAGGEYAAERNAVCVIGVKEVGTQTFASVGGATSSNSVLTTRASCKLKGTSMNPLGTSGENDINGVVDMWYLPATSSTRVRFIVNGLQPSMAHTWHVHQEGNLCLDDGASTGGHFIGTCTSCPSGRTEVGQIGNYNPQLTNAMMNTDANGVAEGEFDDNIVKFWGANNIVGRSMIIHNSTGARVAQCTIGRTLEEPTAYQPDYSPAIEQAACRFTPTFWINPVTNFDALRINGYMHFKQVGGTLTMDFRVQKLPVGAHTMEFRTRGDLISEDNGASTTTAYPGAPTYTFEASSLGGQGGGSFSTTAVSLNGANSIIGRSVVILGTNDGSTGASSKVIAECVVGMAQEANQLNSDGSAYVAPYCSLLDFVTYPPPAENSSSTDVGLIVGWTIGSIAMAVIFALIIWYLFCKDPVDVKEARKGAVQLGSSQRQAVGGKHAPHEPTGAPPGVVLSGAETSEAHRAASDGLPPNWEAHYDEESSTYYYYNTETQESVWVKPTE